MWIVIYQNEEKKFINEGEVNKMSGNLRAFLLWTGSDFFFSLHNGFQTNDG